MQVDGVAGGLKFDKRESYAEREQELCVAGKDIGVALVRGMNTAKTATCRARLGQIAALRPYVIYPIWGRTAWLPVPSIGAYGRQPGPMKKELRGYSVTCRSRMAWLKKSGPKAAPCHGGSVHPTPTATRAMMGMDARSGDSQTETRNETLADCSQDL